jgi:hypothetical protein
LKLAIFICAERERERGGGWGESNKGPGGVVEGCQFHFISSGIIEIFNINLKNRIKQNKSHFFLILGTF